MKPKASQKFDFRWERFKLHGLGLALGGCTGSRAQIVDDNNKWIFNKKGKWLANKNSVNTDLVSFIKGS